MKEQKKPLIRLRDHMLIALGGTVLFGIFFALLLAELLSSTSSRGSGAAVAVFLAALAGIVYYACFSASRAAEEHIRMRYIPEDYPCLACPQCKRLYKPEDYRSDAPHLYCSYCKSELPMQTKEIGEQRRL